MNIRCRLGIHRWRTARNVGAWPLFGRYEECARCGVRSFVLHDPHPVARDVRLGWWPSDDKASDLIGAYGRMFLAAQK